MILCIQRELSQHQTLNLAILCNKCYCVCGSAAQRQAVSYISEKEVKHMPITVTFHVFIYTITITVKSRNRHSDK